MTASNSAAPLTGEALAAAIEGIDALAADGLSKIQGIAHCVRLALERMELSKNGEEDNAINALHAIVSIAADFQNVINVEAEQLARIVRAQ